MRRPALLAVGAAHIDRRGRVAGAYVPAASNPGTMREDVGGGAFNAARNAVRHGAAASLMSLRGGDIAGETVARAIADSGIEDLSATFLDRTTPSYTALLDAEGELIAGFADMGLYDAGFPRQMRRRKLRETVHHADAVLCDANMPAPAIAALVGVPGAPEVHAVAISPAKVSRLQAVLPFLACLFMNAREARTLAGLAEEATAAEAAVALAASGLRRGVITAGSALLTGFDETGVFSIVPPRPDIVADVTGAGDAVAGVTVARMLGGTGFREAVRYGVAAATLTIEQDTVVAEYDDAAFATRLALVGQALPVA